MRLLLDSHTLIWLMDDAPLLSRTAAALIADPANQLFVSGASLWEMSIKIGLGKLTLAVSFSRFLKTAIDGYGLELLPVSREDCEHYATLPFPNAGHRDPFDRMLVTQAVRHELKLLSSDSALDAYQSPRIW